jgi:predicted nucleotidyltransferase
MSRAAVNSRINPPVQILPAPVVSSMLDETAVQRVAEPITPTASNRELFCADLLMRPDGTIANVEGWCHPDDAVVCEFLYAPVQSDATTEFFGVPYRKLMFDPVTGDAVPYASRLAWLVGLGIIEQSWKSDLVYARYKTAVPLSCFKYRFPADRTLELRGPAVSGNFERDLSDFLESLSIPSGITIGSTGATLLGKTDGYHDIDLVFSGDLAANRSIADQLDDIARREPQRRVFGGGKGWRLRIRNSFGTIMCCFFGYRRPDMAPIRDCQMSVISDDCTVTGKVANDEHACYTPSLIYLDYVKSHDSGLVRGSGRLCIIVYHTASRGDCRIGDSVRATGTLVEVRMPAEDSYIALCVLERDGLRNLSPPWADYYARRYGAN